MMIPITRKEKYINEIVGGGNTAPETPQTREELFFAGILGEVVAPSPITRAEKYLAKIANKYSGELPEPVTRIERFLAWAAGMNVSIPTPVTREEMFWADYALIVEKELSGIPPLTFNAVAGTLKNYRIYGNTINGEGVGNFVETGEHAGEYRVPVTVTNGTDIQTTNIYLPEKIRKVGDEVEYISYSEQKQHRVRKNLFDAAKSLVSAYIGGINFDYTISSSGSYSILLKCMPNATYTATFPLNNPNHNIRWCSFGREPAPGDIGSNTLYIAAGSLTNLSYTTSTDAAYMMLFLYNSASPPPQSASNYFQSVQIEKGSTATDYEPYIEDTELDVTLSALPTLSGTNTLTVGTEVQPSEAYIKYEGAR